MERSEPIILNVSCSFEEKRKKKDNFRTIGSLGLRVYISWVWVVLF
jgi:hypothetical protein